MFINSSELYVTKQNSRFLEEIKNGSGIRCILRRIANQIGIKSFLNVNNIQKRSGLEMLFSPLNEIVDIFSNYGVNLVRLDMKVDKMYYQIFSIKLKAQRYTMFKQFLGLETKSEGSRNLKYLNAT